jgi:type I restriction enzyme, S subunit
MDPGFLHLVLSSPTVVSAIEGASVGSTMVNLNQGTLAGLAIQAPPRDEQAAIGQAIADAESSLAQLDQLIAKKRDLRQAAMQQLLTARTRLPGFAGSWRTMSIGAFADVIRGVTYKSESDLYPNEHASAVVLLRANNVREGAVNLDDVQFVDQSCVSDHQLLRLNDILICMANGSRQLVGKAARLVQEPADRLTFGALHGLSATPP